MRSIFSKLRSGSKQKLLGQKSFTQATEEDLYYCYRLLLRREPDKPGWDHHKALIDSQHVSIQMLVDGFLHSKEFRELQEAGHLPRLVELEHFKMFVRLNDFFNGAVIYRDKSYEPYVTDEIHQLLKPGMTFVDIGANIGYFTLLAAALVGPQGKVIAFEPNTENCELLTQSIHENNFQNIDLHPYAVAEEEQTFQLDVGGTNSNGRVIDFTPQATPGDGPPRLVKAIVLDDFLHDESRIDVIKVDIEGAEPRALAGMKEIITTHRPILLMEFSPFLIEVTSHVTPSSFLQTIADHGYHIFILERFAKKSSVPLVKEQILDAATQSGLTHLDLVAYPH